MKIVRGGRVAIKVYDRIGLYFPSSKGVRPGDPLSTLIFNIIVDGLTLLIEKAQRQNLITGLVSGLVGGGLSLLQYVDDTIFYWMMDWRMIEASSSYCVCLRKFLV